MNRVFQSSVVALGAASFVGCVTASLPQALSAARAAHAQVLREPSSLIDQGELERANQSLRVAESEAAHDPTTWQAADSSYIAQRRMETVLVHTSQHRLDAHRQQLEQGLAQANQAGPGEGPPGQAFLQSGPPAGAAPTVIQTAPQQTQPTVIVTSNPAPAAPVQVQDDSRVNALTAQVQQLQREIDKDRQSEKDREADEKRAQEKVAEKEAQAKLDEVNKQRQHEQEVALQKKQSQLDEMRKKLDSESKARHQAEVLSRAGQVRQDSRGTVVSIPGGMLFANGKNSLLGSGKKALEDVADALKGGDKRPISVEAYTDSRGSLTSNERLSQRRAQAVRDYLVEQGISDELVTARGMGPANPVADNGTAAGRATNRRIELVVSNAATPSASSADAAAP